MGPQNKQKQRKSRAGRKSRGSAVFGQSGPSCILPAPTKKTYRFERWIAPAAVSTAAADKGHTFSYTLGSFSGASEFTALFDIYRMAELEITFTHANLGISVALPVLNFLADYDSYATPTTFAEVLQRPHKRIVLTPFAPAFTFKLKPRVMIVAQTSSGTSSSALAPGGQWLDCNDSTIVYGGLLGWIEQYNSSTSNQINISVRAVFDFAMVR